MKVFFPLIVFLAIFPLFHADAVALQFATRDEDSVELSAKKAVAESATSELGGLELQGQINKSSYLLGEPVKAQFKFVNNGEQPDVVPSGGVEVGSLKIFIAEAKNGEYKEYFGSGWGRKRGHRLPLNPGSTHSYAEITILWNGKPNVSHLNENAAREALKGRITTEYAFDAVGEYWLKGLSYVGTDFKAVESEPIRVVITEPKGDDLAVWKQVKGVREFAIYMQSGYIDTYDKYLQTEIPRQIIILSREHPNSIYAAYLQPKPEWIPRPISK